MKQLRQACTSLDKLRLLNAVHILAVLCLQRCIPRTMLEAAELDSIEVLPGFPQGVARPDRGKIVDRSIRHRYCLSLCEQIRKRLETVPTPEYFPSREDIDIGKGRLFAGLFLVREITDFGGIGYSAVSSQVGRNPPVDHVPESNPGY